MPKSKKRKKPAGRPRKPSGQAVSTPATNGLWAHQVGEGQEMWDTLADDEFPSLRDSPARTFLDHGEGGEEINEGVREILPSWPFRISWPGGGSRITSLEEEAETVKLPLKELAERFLDLEEAKFLFWNNTNNTYVMTTPDPS